MPNFSNPLEFNSGEPLNDRDLLFALQQCMADEAEAAMRYEKIAEATDDSFVKDVLLDIAREEHIHIGEFRRAISIKFPEFAAIELEGKKEVDEKFKDIER